MKKKIIKLLIILIITIISASVIFYFSTIDTVELKSNVSVTIPSGSGTKAIANILYKNGIIKNSSAFIHYVKKANASTGLKAGQYSFDAGTITFESILKMLLKGGSDDNSINVTIPEGLTIKQTAELLSSKGLVDYDLFMDYAKKLEIPYSYIKKGTDETQLEGFLFPDTYNFSKSWTEKEIINTMLNQFDKVWTDEYQKRADELKLNVKEVVTIASLIEREAKVASERPLISSVIHNRLKIDMPLQIDATIQYILGKQKEKLLYKDLEIESPYNTYLNKGLTPSPIAAPGSACIKAALYPENTEYLYYRTKNNGSGEHYFSKTFSEHKSHAN